MNRGLVIKTYGDPTITTAIASAMVPAAEPSISQQLHEHLYGYIDPRGPEYYARETRKARRKYAHNPTPSRPARVVWGIVGAVCVAVDGCYRRLSAWNRGETS